MQKLKIGCLAGVCLIVALLLWINFTPLLRMEVAASLDRGQKEFDTRHKKYANDPETNIYLSSKFRELWCIRTELASEGGKITLGPVTKTINDFYEFHGQLKTVQNSDQLKSLTKDPKFLSSRQAFQELMPELEKALNRPAFVAPDQKADMLTLVPQLMGLRKAACGLALEAEVENFEQNPEAAWLRLKAALNSSEALGGFYPTLIELMVSVSIQNSAWDSLYQVLAKHPKLSDKTLAGIAIACDAQGIPAVSLSRSLEMELVGVNNTVHSDAFAKEVAQGGVLSQSLWLAAKGSGLANREWRLYANDWMSLIDNARLLSTPDLAWTHQESWPAARDWILGRHGILSAIAVPNFGRAQLQIRKVRSKIAAIQILVALERYHSKHGQFPKSLTDLEMGPGHIDKPTLASFHYSLKDGQPQLSFQLDPEIMATISDESPFGRMGALEESSIQLLPYAAPRPIKDQSMAPEALQGPPPATPEPPK